MALPNPFSMLDDSQPVDGALEQKAINTIRVLALDAVQTADSGHAGMPMGMAPAAVALWTRYLRYNPKDPKWANRDRFVLSAGHGSMLLYSLLHLTGFDLPLEQLKNFRQWGSVTAGHPEYWYAPGIETTTGPLGQGFANGVGMAMAEAWLAAHYNRPDFTIVDHHTYAIVSDGDLMEGVASEAASLAGHLQLGKLIYFYDNNHVTIDGQTDIAYTEDWAKRFEAYGWHVIDLDDGMDVEAVGNAIEAAQNDPRPSLIGCRTIIGKGAPTEGTSSIHSDALPEDQYEQTRQNLGFGDIAPFDIPNEVSDFFGRAVEQGQKLSSDYSDLMEAYSEEYPDLAAQYQRAMRGELPDGWEEALPTFEAGESVATRNAGGEVINALHQVIPNLIGGSADLAASTKNTIKDGGDFQAGSYGGDNIHFGVREHGMASAVNGMALHGGVIPFGATFFTFSDYMRPTIRLAAMSHAQSIFIFTHDSIGVGEDGPTHQPVEQLASVRAIPKTVTVRPADANETSEAWRIAIQRQDGPTLLILSRQKLPTFDRSNGIAAASGTRRGGYTFWQSGDGTPDVILIATGSEVSVAYEAAQQLAESGTNARVVSLPSWEIFGEQDESYRSDVLPLDVPKVAVEAGASFGWERWVGNDPAKGALVTVDKFGHSAPGSRVLKEYGFNAENIVKVARGLLA